MTATITTGVYLLLKTEYVEALDRLASDPESSAPPFAAGEAARFVAERLELWNEAVAATFVISDRNQVVGVCGLDQIGRGEAREIRCWVGPEHRRKGYGTFGIKKVLDFAFRNRRLDRVSTPAPEPGGARRVLEKNGFTAAGGWYQLTREAWRDFQNGPALAALHPALKRILEAELAAGNEVAETGGGWPDPDSVFVRLRDPFRTRPTPLPEGVFYTEPNDPHWWKADYGTVSPRHVLAC
jgi:RimJ/RimL family protein N-acetyltransferase